MPRIILCTMLLLTLSPIVASGAGTPAVTKPTPAATTETTRTEVQAFVKGYIDAVNRADVTAMMEMFSREPGVTSVADGEIERGWDAIRTDADQIVGKEGSYKFSIGSIDVTPLGTSYALMVAPLTVKAPAPQDSAEAPGAMTLLVKKSGKTWLIVHEHWSSKPQEEEQQEGE